MSMFVARILLNDALHSHKAVAPRLSAAIPSREEFLAIFAAKHAGAAVAR